MSCRGYCRLIGIERNREMVWNATPPSIIRSSSLAFHVPTTRDEGSITRSKKGYHKETCQDSSSLFGWSASVVMRNTNRHDLVSFFFLVSTLYP
mmetsp:Transcript_19792/g.35931  ORF Transcript_19792/g.35931 Transcript_19792/m.35931 type:complete len:94 (-) Transcript_19792:98-379(-)